MAEALSESGRRDPELAFRVTFSKDIESTRILCPIKNATYRGQEVGESVPILFFLLVISANDDK